MSLDIVGKTVDRVDEETWWGTLIYFTDGSVLETSGRDAELELHTGEHMASLIADSNRAEAIMERAWAEHRAALDSPLRVPAGWGGFYRLPDAEPWPTWKEDVEWLDKYHGNGRDSFTGAIKRAS